MNINHSSHHKGEVGDNIGTETSMRPVSNTSKGSGRKVMELSKLKQTLRNSLTSFSSTKLPKTDKKQRKIIVKQINLISKAGERKGVNGMMITSCSSKQLLTGIKSNRKNQQSEESEVLKKTISIINRPAIDHNTRMQTKLLQSDIVNCENIGCSHSQNEQICKINKLKKRQRPNIHSLAVNKRQVKIVTSKAFNERRSKDSILQSKLHFKERKALEQTKRIVIPPRLLSLK